MTVSEKPRRGRPPKKKADTEPKLTYLQQRGEIPGGGLFLVPFGEFHHPWPSDNEIFQSLMIARTKCEFPGCTSLAGNALVKIENHLPFLCDVHYRLCAEPSSEAGNALRELRYYLRGLIFDRKPGEKSASRKRLETALTEPYVIPSNRGLAYEQMAPLVRAKLGQ